MANLFDMIGALVYDQLMGNVLGNREFIGVAILAIFIGVMLMMREAKVEFKLMITICAIFLAGAFLPIIMLLGAAIIAFSLLVIYKRVTGW